MNVILVFFTLLLTKDSTEYSFNPRIAGGQDASRNQFPFMASVQLILPPLTIYAHACAAVVLTTQWLLSSAVCVLKVRSIGAAKVHINKHYTNRNDDRVKIFDVNDTRVHEYFNMSSNIKPYDLGLLHLTDPISRPVRVKLPDPRLLPVVDAFIIGWGITSAASYGIMPEVLQFAIVRGVDNEHCQLLLPRRYERLKESQICVQKFEKPITGCKGDSGGPVIRYVDGVPEVVGIMSWSLNPCGRVGAPTVSSRITSFNAWIIENVGRRPNRMSDSDDLYTPLLV